MGYRSKGLNKWNGSLMLSTDGPTIAHKLLTLTGFSGFIVHNLVMPKANSAMNVICTSETKLVPAVFNYNY